MFAGAGGSSEWIFWGGFYAYQAMSVCVLGAGVTRIVLLSFVSQAFCTYTHQHTLTQTHSQTYTQSMQAVCQQ